MYPSNTSTWKYQTVGSDISELHDFFTFVTWKRPTDQLNYKWNHFRTWKMKKVYIYLMELLLLSTLPKEASSQRLSLRRCFDACEVREYHCLDSFRWVPKPVSQRVDPQRHCCTVHHWCRYCCVYPMVCNLGIASNWKISIIWFTCIWMRLSSMNYLNILRS